MPEEFHRRIRELPAILGGPKAVGPVDEALFRWPIVTEEDEQAVLDVLRAGTMSQTDVTVRFESEYATFQQTRYALAHCNGTMALLTAMFAVGLGRGDELISPSLTYWATALPCFLLGATSVFADIDPVTLCVDARDVERRITPRTRAIIVTHYCGHPCDMDAILSVARRHGLKVIEDVSHAHGALYKGRRVGSLGDVSAASLMAAKSFPVGEGGMLCTDSRETYERAVAFAHYERTWDVLTLPELRATAGLPLGGVKGRINQTCSAMGRVQLKHYLPRIAEIQAGMNRFWDLLEDVPGLSAHRPPRHSGLTMGGWYNPLGHYRPEELHGLPVARFIEAVNAEGGRVGRGCNLLQHLHPVLNDADVFHDAKPTRIAFAGRDVRQGPGSLPVTESIPDRVFGVPWFKHDWPEPITQFATAYAKVALHAKELAEHFQEKSS
ncbi:MAG TPA: DegT/DnrJ/EryC1/StrS family aminotransferase [Phycisphaerae bacterium]|nr:DegT/DnrJ/EryC1/StrS family aminotransferase [Phycisphaerae bacterium]